MKRIYVVTGPKGSGKSTAIASFARPSELNKVCIVDTEDSMSDILRDNDRNKVEFGCYVRMYDRMKTDKDLLEQIAQGKLPWISTKDKNAIVGYYEFFVQTMHEKLTKGTFTILGIDTIESIEAGMAMWARVNKNISGWSGKEAFGGLEVEAMRPLYENLLESFSRRGVEDIVLSSHLHQPWVNNRPVLDRLKAGGRTKLLSQLSTAMFWLVPGVKNEDGAPAAITLKSRFTKREIVNDEWVITRPLPDRIPSFSWKNVRWYLEHGCNHKNPPQDETLSDVERDMISEMLSDQQMKLMIVGAELELEQAKGNAMPDLGSVADDEEESPKIEVEKVDITGLDGEALTVKVKELLVGNTPQVVATMTGLPMPKVLKISKG